MVISGYYGFGNAGDEAVLQGVLAGLRHAAVKEAESIEAVVLSADPAATRRVHGVEAVSRWSAPGVWRALRGADLLVSGGGGLIQDRTSARSSLYYLGVIAMARAARLPVYVYGQGVGPIRRRALRILAGLCLQGVRGAGVRDEASLRLLQEIGVPRERLFLAADAAFALEPPSMEEVCDALRSVGLDGATPGSFAATGGHLKLSRPMIGVVWRSPWVEVRPRRNAADDSGTGRGASGALRPREAIAQAVASFARACGGTVVVIPFHPAVDFDECRGFAGASAEKLGESAVVVAGIGSEENFCSISPRRMMALIAGMDVAVCVRFHGLVFAAVAGVPAVALAYDPKVRSLAETLGVPWFPPGADPSLIESALVRVWEDRENLARRLLARSAELRARSMAEAERALRLARAAGWEREWA